METDTYNLLATFLTVIAIIVSLVAMIVSIVYSKITTDVATQTQEIAQRALDIEAFRHKKEIDPILELKYSLSIELPKYGKSVYVGIYNRNFGKATVTNVEPSGHIIIRQIPVLPFELPRNNPLQFECEIHSFMYDQVILKGMEAIHKDDPKAIHAAYTHEFNRVMRSAWFTVEYHDSIGTPYRINFVYNKDKESFYGDPIEIRKS